ncbi:hypothetical protein STEG23_011967, partial [Scotinomys teguina]
MANMAQDLVGYDGDSEELSLPNTDPRFVPVTTGVWIPKRKPSSVVKKVRPTQLHGKPLLPGPTSVADLRRALMAGRP